MPNDTSIMPVLKSGIYQGITNAAYHGDKSTYSSTLIKKMEVPAEAQYYMQEPPEFKDAYHIGGAIHKWVLERDLFNTEFLTGIKCTRRSNADKLAWGQWFTEYGDGRVDGYAITENNPAAKWNPLFQEQSGYCMVTPDEIEAIRLMAESVMSNPNAARLLSEGAAEQSVFWEDKETGLRLKVRPDYLSSAFTSDLKSIESVHDHHITRSMANFGYGISQAMYQQGVQAVTGNWLPFLFIYVEKNPPYQCRVIALDQESQEVNFENYIALKARLAECLVSDKWPGLPDNLEFILPAWATR